MATRRTPDALAELLRPYAERSTQALQRLLVEPGTPAALAEAMRYCVLGGGKRLRPALVFMSAEAAGDGHAADLTARAAAAVEMVHCYSLVHDDLPAMDDDDLRRGRPTAHVKFGEAMAILAGDGLITRAFGVLAETADPRSALLAAELARNAGAAGVIAGQAADMNLCDVPGGLEGLKYIHLHKTAALLRAAARMGAICGGAGEEAMAAVTEYAESLGLAFQLVDDILDVTGSAEELGKTPGKDADGGKRTYVAAAGLAGARELAEGLTASAEASAERLGRRGRTLKELAHLLCRRTY
jgi:geranylgeranyl pyrophosphate synthase